MIKQLFTIISDIRNLYSSRDGLWKEVFKLQQTSKRRDKELRQRLHRLEERQKRFENYTFYLVDKIIKETGYDDRDILSSIDNNPDVSSRSDLSL